MQPLPVDDGERERVEATIERLEGRAARGDDYAARQLPNWQRELARVEAAERYWRIENASSLE